jgi:competence protein ComEA
VRTSSPKRLVLRHVLAMVVVSVVTFVAANSRVTAAAAQQEAPKDLLPDADGKAMVIKKCTQCHDATRFTALRHNEDEWDQVITRMQSNGLSMTDEEYGIVLNYLSKNLGASSAPRNDGHD